jgi:translation elongation factor EF-1beta
MSCPSSGQAKGACENKKDNKENKKDNKKPAAKADDFDNMFGDEEEAAPAPAAKKTEDFDNMFGDDEDGETAEEKAATKARKERMETARKLKEEKDLKEGKKKAVKEAEKSLVVLEVKPWEADTDLEMVWKKICEYKQEGLNWGANFKLEPVAFGIKKLVMTCVIVDALVLMDDVTENIEALDQWVQSVEVASMNKI